VTVRIAAAALMASVLACAGCGGAAHKAARTRSAPRPTPTETAAAAAAAAASTITAAQAIRAFAAAYINWDARTVSLDMRALATRSIGQARAAMTLAAAGTAGDYELQRGGIANHGTVEAVAPLPGHEHEYVVVTLESTTATNTTAYQGLRPAWHVALATATEQRPGRWMVSAWQPES
jgi:ABC-type glycerol-3-phosphate transport system substrate-binding protein